MDNTTNLYGGHVVEVPAEFCEANGLSGNARIVGSIEGQPFRQALHREENRYYFLVGPELRKRLGLRAGSPVEVVLGPDPNPDAVDLPEELAAVLDLDPVVRERFEVLSPGKQRSLAHRVASAKRADTRAKRAADILAHLEVDEIAALFYKR